MNCQRRGDTFTLANLGTVQVEGTFRIEGEGCFYTFNILPLSFSFGWTGDRRFSSAAIGLTFGPRMFAGGATAGNSNIRLFSWLR